MMTDSTGRTWLWLALHYVEMVAAMAAGMVLLGPLLSAPLPAGPAAGVIAMSVAMSAGMAAWMLLRRHGWRPVAEMAACMLLPAAAALPALAVASEGLVMIGLHVAMLGAMAAVMIRRREHYGHRPHRLPWLGKLLRRTAIGAGAVGLAVLPVGLGVQQRQSEPYAGRADHPALAEPVAASTLPRDGKPVAVILTGNAGAEIGDVLGPYRVLAATGKYHLYTVAPERNLLPLTGGLDLLPELSFGDLDRLLAGRAPDLVVVPAMPDLGRPSSEPVRAWLARQHERGTLTLGVCAGARLVAAAGLLQGRPATSHWARLGGLKSEFPDTRWQRGVRWVDAGDVVTTAGILSGIDGALHVVERQFGPAVAAAAARDAGWSGWRPGPAAALPPSGVQAGDLAVMIRAGYDWDRPTIGIRLRDGADELALAAAFDTWGGQSYAARTVALAPRIAPVRSAHGLRFLPRATEAGARVDRIVDPPAATGFPFEVTLRELARSTDVPTARWAAKLLEYPVAGAALDGPGWPWALTLRPLALIALLLAAAAAGSRLVRLVLTGEPPQDGPPLPVAAGLPAVPLAPEQDLYGGILFQGPRFQRLRRYHRAAARHVDADLATGPGGDWFAPFLAQRLVLGDPGMRDALMHGNQVCVPDATLLPARIERLVPRGPVERDEVLRYCATERERNGDSYVYDIVVRTQAGEVVERWDGLVLQAVGKRDGRGPWAPALLGPYLQRSLGDLIGVDLDVAVEPGTDRERGTDLAAGRALGRPVQVGHRPDGKPELPGRAVSLSHTGQLTLCVTGPVAVGCDLEPVRARPEPEWQGLLSTHAALARLIARETGEPADLAATRVWTALECLAKAGLTGQAPLAFARGGPAGWVLLTGSGATVATLATTVQGPDEQVVVAVLAAGR